MCLQRYDCECRFETHANIPIVLRKIIAKAFFRGSNRPAGEKGQLAVLNFLFLETEPVFLL
jgi:hypothetical protein